jgi:hypothetical protein
VPENIFGFAAGSSISFTFFNITMARLLKRRGNKYCFDIFQDKIYLNVSENILFYKLFFI